MKDMKPVAWLEKTGCNRYETDPDAVSAGEEAGISYTPLYAIPDGCVVVPVEPTEGMRSAYLDASIAPISTLSIAGYKAMIKTAQEKGDGC